MTAAPVTPATATGEAPREVPIAKGTPAVPTADAAHRYFAQLEIKPGLAKAALLDLYGELLSHFIADPNAAVSLHIELSAEFPKGASAQLKRISENAGKLPGVKVKNSQWE